jgi:hypothetical protein
MSLEEKVYGFQNIPEEIEAIKYFFNRFSEFPDKMASKEILNILVKEAVEKQFPLPPEGKWSKEIIENILKNTAYDKSPFI